MLTGDQPIVLIVEDDPMLRMGAVDMVIEAGFNSLEASNADEAIAILEHNPNILVVFTDIQMPGSMDGIRLSAIIRRNWPPIKLIVTSGQVTLREGELPEGAAFIGKPYTLAELSALLREISSSSLTA